MQFGSDNTVGATEQILQAIVEANQGHQLSYGADSWCVAAQEAISNIFATEVRAFFVTTGTVANSLALSALVPPWGSVLCQGDAHVFADESTAPEFFTGGARLVPVAPIVTTAQRGEGEASSNPSVNSSTASVANAHSGVYANAGANAGSGANADAGKLQVAALERLLANEGHPPHNVRPHALTITQCNERGLIYTPAEVSALCAVAGRHHMRVHMDGARFANAVVALGCEPADITWRAGVDVLTLGASKNGALMAEAVVFFDPKLANDFEHRIKRAGQMAAKSRFLGAQFVGWLRNGHWLQLARHANAIARLLAQGLTQLNGIRLAWPAQANEVFVIMPSNLASGLRSRGAVFYDWPVQTLPFGKSLQTDEVLVRMVTSYASTEADVVALLDAARALAHHTSGPIRA